MTNLTPEEKAILERLENGILVVDYVGGFSNYFLTDLKKLLESISTERARASKLVEALEALCIDWEKYSAEASEWAMSLPDIINRKNLHETSRQALAEFRGGK